MQRGVSGLQAVTAFGRVLLQCGDVDDPLLDDGWPGCGPAEAPVEVGQPEGGESDNSATITVIAVVSAIVLLFVIAIVVFFRYQSTREAWAALTGQAICDCPVPTDTSPEAGLRCPQCNEPYSVQGPDDRDVEALPSAAVAADRRPHLKSCGHSICGTCAVGVVDTLPCRELPLNHQAIALLKVAVRPGQGRYAHIRAMAEAVPHKAGPVVHGPSAEAVGGPMRCPFCFKPLGYDKTWTLPDARPAAFACGHGGCLRCLRQFEGECLHGCQLRTDQPAVVNDLALHLLKLLSQRSTPPGDIQKGLHSMYEGGWTTVNPRHFPGTGNPLPAPIAGKMGGFVGGDMGVFS